MSSSNPSCACPTSKKEKTNIKGNYSIVSGLLIALIPKCPYCILAYSSAITMCSGTKLYSHTLGWTSYLPLGLAALTLLLVITNYKGKRTLTAAAFVVVGSILMLMGEFYKGQINLYYLGTFFVLSGVWINASFRFFYKKLISKILFKARN